MKKKGVLLIVLTLAFNLLSAQVSLQEIRKSEKLKKSILISLRNNLSIDYELDTKRKNPSTLDTLDFFQVKSDEFRVYAKFVNPLKYRLTINGKSLEDESEIEASNFITNAIQLLSGTNKMVESFSSSRSMSIEKEEKEEKEEDKKTLEIDLAEVYLNIKLHAPEAFSEESDLIKAMYALNLSEISKKVSTAYDSIFSELKKINKISEITKQVNSKEPFFKAIDKYIETLDNNYKKLKAASDKFDSSNKVFEEYLKAKINSIGSEDLVKFKEEAKNLKEKYTKIIDYFEKIKNEGYETENKYKLFNITNLDTKKRHELTLKVEQLKFDDKKKTLTVEKVKTYKIHVRKYKLFTPVISSGVVYTDVSFTTYGTSEDEAGNTIIVEGEEEENELAIGAYLNLYLNNNWNTPLFFQFGVGPSKEKPLFFLGAGISILERINISTGGVFTWMPKLNDLSVGQQVNGSAIIDKDISFQFDNSPKFYLGLSFDLTKK